ncbi:MAG: hypothetical protein J5I41_12925 [Saprospiraceae bacterium]|nr:hypothetical protein [Saprospiraceae bacterium]
MRQMILGVAALLFLLAGCRKTSDCPPCGYYTGLSTKVDFIPGTMTGSYTTSTRTYEVKRSGDGYSAAGWYYLPDVNGYYTDTAALSEQQAKGYITLTVWQSEDTLRFDVRQPEGLSEYFEGLKIN